MAYCKSLPENCIGGNASENYLCYKGHIGPLCEECDVRLKKYIFFISSYLSFIFLQKEL